MRGILISPPAIAVNICEEDGFKEAVEQAGSYPPVGLAYIAAVLRGNGIDVKIIDAKALKMSHKEVAKMVQEEEPGLVGVTIFTTQLRSALIMCQEIKEACPTTKIVVGGPHINPLHQEVIREPFIDFCVMGEGEMTMLELMDAISDGTDFKEIKGLSLRIGAR